MSATASMRSLVQPRRTLPLAAICLGHGALLWWLTTTMARMPPEVVPPSVIGTLVSPSPAPVEAPKPLPMAPVPTPPRPAEPAPPVPPARPVASVPIPRPTPPPAPLPATTQAPPSERSVTTPPSEPPTPAPASPPRQEDAPTAAPAPVATPREVSESPKPVTLPRSDAAFLNNPAPVYPTMSRRLKEQGRVVFDVYILPDGHVGEIKLKRSSGHSRLDDAALEAVRQWRYVPARRGDEPIPYWYVQSLDFALDS